MDEIIGVLVFLVWMAFNVISAFRKRKLENEQKTAKKSTRPIGKEVIRESESEQPSFEEMVREIRQNSEQKREVIKEEAVKSIETMDERRQKLIKEQEERRARRYNEFVKRQRSTKHVAENHQLEQEILKINKSVGSDDKIDFDVDLRTLILSEVILNRKYK